MVLPRLICEMIWALYWSVLSERLLGDRVRPDVVFWYVLPLGAIVKREMAPGFANSLSQAACRLRAPIFME